MIRGTETEVGGDVTEGREEESCVCVLVCKRYTKPLYYCPLFSLYLSLSLSA